MTTLDRAGFLLLVILALTVEPGLAAAKSKVPKQGTPPRHLKQQSDGHWSANQLPASAEGYEIHAVKAGDTLWDITRQYLKDPFLWPQVWELNENLINPHWIYPGDKVILKKMVVVAPPPETPAPPSATPEAPAPAAPPVQVVAETAPPAPPSPPPLPPPAASYTDLYCSGFFAAEGLKSSMVIVGGEESENKTLFSDQDIVYVNRGASDGVKPGDEYLVVRQIKDFAKYGPDVAKAGSRKKYGVGYRDLGRVRILLAHDKSATAEVVSSCEELNVGDVLIPFEQRISPPKRAQSSFDKFAPPSEKAQGTIFMAKDFRTLIGAGQIVYLDVGQRQNVQVGDYFRVFRVFQADTVSVFNRSEYKKYQGTFDSLRKVIGEVLVLRVEAKTVTAMVTQSTEDFKMGDGVELE